MTTEKLSEETEQKIVNSNPIEVITKIVNPNPIEVITFLDHHRLAILFKVYLLEAIAILKLPRVTSNGRLWVGT